MYKALAEPRKVSAIGVIEKELVSAPRSPTHSRQRPTNNAPPSIEFISCIAFRAKAPYFVEGFFESFGSKMKWSRAPSSLEEK